MSNMDPTTGTWASHVLSNENRDEIVMAMNIITDKSTAMHAMTLQHSEESNPVTRRISDIWYRCDLHLQKDRDVALIAVETRCIPTNIQEWPTELKHDIEFWNAFLSYQGNGRYEDNESTNRRKIRSDGWCIPKWGSNSQINSVLHSLPGLSRNVNFWYTVLCSNYASSDLLLTKAHPSIFSNKRFMLDVIQNDYTVYDALCPPLNQDEDIVVTALETNPNSIIHIPTFIQEMYPDAVMKSIRNLDQFTNRSRPNRHEFVYYVSRQLWRNRDIVVALISKGASFRPEDCPVEFTSDEEIFLLIAQHCAPDFYLASSKLRSDKAYMTKAVSIDAEVFFEVEDNLKYDYELAVIAYSSTNAETILNFEDVYGHDFFHDFRAYLEEKMRVHDSFFLFMMSVHHEHKQGASMEMAILNQGTETTSMIFQHIHEFVGSPKGLEWIRIRQAHENFVTFYGDRFPMMHR